MHELSHLITHLGVKDNGLMWSYFNNAGLYVKEFLAQFWTDATLNDNGLDRDFVEWLVNHSPAQYKAYQEIKKLSAISAVKEVLEWDSNQFCQEGFEWLKAQASPIANNETQDGFATVSWFKIHLKLATKDGMQSAGRHISRLAARRDNRD